ncbi:hypothetical protein [Bacteroides thetaiotaomicron]|jgi:hypothetical protein|uniref:hypothetical protein n=1 Tax=Bacteroides thetaiotaomicron TaxID=818 RepID=UPI000E49780B|nr:hypothetical protein [Bacteroides thetaiotaomicron]RHJ68450.1 hypothetical protein DW108_14285 [Bacteroides thetaiotaomicron]DAT98823.1 MAG TPA: hypothetical protein [Caudoviricetes sp.]
MNSPKVVAVLLIVCEQDSHNDPEEMVSKVVTEEEKLIQIKLENLKYEIDDFIHEESKQVRFGWHTRDKPFHPQNFKREITWHRIRSRCF